MHLSDAYFFTLGFVLLPFFDLLLVLRGITGPITRHGRHGVTPLKYQLKSEAYEEGGQAMQPPDARVLHAANPSPSLMRPRNPGGSGT